jgi:acetyl-CoA decarbonylase/synthase complex subunit gamma
MEYKIRPGLYAVGNPDANAPVFASANYRLSFDILRRELGCVDAWILVLDTKGINVWCAAGKRTFGTNELVARIRSARLADVVSHKKIIVPQLGAPGICAHEVRKQTGFTVRYGPVRAKDIPAYLKNDWVATREMRTVGFGFVDRLVLTPMELIPSLKVFLPAAVALFVLFGLEKQGIIFSQAMLAFPFILLGFIAILCGSFITPVLLPYIPGRAFSIKGWLVGMAAVIIFLASTRAIHHWQAMSAAIIAFPVVSSFCALNFTGSTPYTSMSGVKKEMKYAVPAYIAAGAITLVLFVYSRLLLWGVL